jgi:hypothetical protein
LEASCRLSVAPPHLTATPNNDLGWAPGAAVELWVTNSSMEQSFSPYAGWANHAGQIEARVATIRGIFPVE